MALRMRWSGIRLLEVFKLLLAVSFGLSLRTVFDISFGKLECPQCPSCAPKKDQDSPLLPADVHQQLREPYKPKTMYDVIRYDYFNTRHIFNNIDDDPRIGLAGFQKANIRDAIHQALLLFNSGKPQEWKYKSLMNGYKRQDPLRGEEYIFDLEIHQASKPEVTKMERIEIVKPFTSAHLVDNHSVQTSKVVHFILPVTGSSARFTHFLLEYEKVVLLSKAAARMIVILFVGTTLPEQKSAEKLKTMITDINRRYRLSKIKLIQTKKMFSRALGLDLGAKQLPGNSLLFFCDIDVTITPSFLSRCRNNAILEKQVYYPIVFGQYQPDIVVDHSPEDQVKDLMTINKYTGHWVHYGFGMVCLHTRDYRSVGGFDLKIKGWGGEDVDLYTKHIKSKLKVFRAVDPDLVHRYHNKTCDPHLTSHQHRMCVDANAEGLGSKTQLAKKFIINPGSL